MTHGYLYLLLPSHRVPEAVVLTMMKQQPQGLLGRLCVQDLKIACRKIGSLISFG